MNGSIRRWVLVAAASSLALVAVACSGGSSTTAAGEGEQAAAGPARVEIMLSEFKIDPAAITVPAGQSIEFTVMNMGQRSTRSRSTWRARSTQPT